MYSEAPVTTCRRRWECFVLEEISVDSNGRIPAGRHRGSRRRGGLGATASSDDHVHGTSQSIYSSIEKDFLGGTDRAVLHAYRSLSVVESAIVPVFVR